jgi:hypothetical protein
LELLLEVHDFKYLHEKKVHPLAWES